MATKPSTNKFRTLSEEIKKSITHIHADSGVIKEHVGFLHDVVPAIEGGISVIHRHQSCQRHHTITNWLSSANFAVQQSDIMARRQENTGLWLLDSTKFHEWIHGPKETLLCPGIPGVGKTVIAAIAIDHLSKAIQRDGIGLGYIYCNYKAQADQSSRELLAAFLKQLVQGQQEITKSVQDLYDHHSRTSTRPSLKEIKAELYSVLSNLSHTYLVIDGLDECECDTRTHLLATFRDLQGRVDLRFMVTSRFLPDINEEFRTSPQLEIRASEADLERFVQGQIHRLPKCIRSDSELQRIVKNRIIEAADGV